MRGGEPRKGKWGGRDLREFHPLHQKLPLPSKNRASFIDQKEKKVTITRKSLLSQRKGGGPPAENFLPSKKKRKRGLREREYKKKFGILREKPTEKKSSHLTKEGGGTNIKSKRVRGRAFRQKKKKETYRKKGTARTRCLERGGENKQRSADTSEEDP